MTDASFAGRALEAIRHVRQTRRFTSRPVGPDALHQILEIARWSGSSQNSQPWQFIVVDDRDELRQLGAVRDANSWVSSAPVAIAVVLDGDRKISEAHDAGRVTERIMIAANLLGLGAGLAWFVDASQQAQAKEILGVPEEATARALIAIGHPDTSQQRSTGDGGGRKPLDEIVSYGRIGKRC